LYLTYYKTLTHVRYHSQHQFLQRDFVVGLKGKEDIFLSPALNYQYLFLLRFWLSACIGVRRF
jgi:hypothetical protein